MSKAQRRRWRRANQNIGSSPGTLTQDPDALKTVIKVTSYNGDDYQVSNSVRAADLLAMVVPGKVCWIQVIGLGDVATIREIGTQFKLHRLTLEDVTNVNQRPKLEQYGQLFFVIARIIETIDDCKSSHQLSMYLGPNFVITFHEREFRALESVHQRIAQKLGRIRSAGPDYLSYAIIDCIVDQYFPVLEHLAEQLDSMEDNLFTFNRTQALKTLHSLRHDLLSMRRMMWPLRDVINSLMRENTDMIVEETKIHLRDCYDHSVQIVELIESYRELGASLMELSVSLMSHRLNEGIRILTVISTVFIPLNFIAGVYGMNFNTNVSGWNMPELNWTLGYPFAISIMVLVTLAQLTLFWRKGWLRESEKV